jgi:beta-lactamase class A
MTIDTRLAEIRARVDAATEGPWEDVVDDLNDDVDVWRDGESRLWVANTGEVFTASAQRARQILADAEFIAASRTDLPALLAAVEAVREKCTLAIEEFEDPVYEDNGYALGIVAASRTLLNALTAALEVEG